LDNKENYAVSIMLLGDYEIEFIFSSILSILDAMHGVI
jgi:hypothetical protein